MNLIFFSVRPQNTNFSICWVLFSVLVHHFLSHHVCPFALCFCILGILFKFAFHITDLIFLRNQFSSAQRLVFSVLVFPITTTMPQFTCKPSPSLPHFAFLAYYLFTETKFFYSDLNYDSLLKFDPASKWFYFISICFFWFSTLIYFSLLCITFFLFLRYIFLINSLLTSLLILWNGDICPSVYTTVHFELYSI